MTRSYIAFLLFLSLYCHASQYPAVSGAVNREKFFLAKTKIRYFLDKGKEFLYKPESFKKDMDSAKANFNKAFALSNRIKDHNLINECIVGYSEILFEENNYSQAEKNLQKVIDYYHKTKQFEKEAATWQMLGARLFWKTPRSFETLENAVKIFDKATILYKNLGLQDKFAFILKYKADAHLNQGRLDLAEKELLQVLEVYNKTGYKKLHFTYDLLADVYRLKGDLGKNLYYSQLCVNSMEKARDFRFAPVFYQQLAIAYKDLGKHDTSIDLMKKAIVFLKSEKEMDYSNLYEFIDLLSKELVQEKKYKEALHQVQKILKEYPPKKKTDQARMHGSLAYCYNKIGQVQIAETNFKKMITLYEENTSSTMYVANLSGAYFEFGKFYEEHKKYDQAKYYFEKSLNFSNGIVELSQVKEANLYLFKIDSANGKYNSAIKYFQKFKNLNDSIFNEKKNKQIEELQILYGLEKKEKEFSNLKLAMDAQRTTNIKSQSTIKFGICVVVFLFVSTMLFWGSYKSKQKNNELLISQKNEIDQKNIALQKLLNEKESLMQEIHHRVKNNLQIVMSLLNSQSSTLKNQEAFDAIQKSQHRLFAISLLHQKLYRTDIVREIEMENYINDLMVNFGLTFDMQHIDSDMQIDPILLDEAQAVSVGLILNETVTNSIKYGFPEKKKGLISVKLQSLENYRVILQIKDNGIGFPEDLNFDTTATLGISLIIGLGQQLDGQVSFFNDNGAVVEVDFVRNTIS
ncbi:histidine kinase dimerization/phosphoacceptor domain -containing protein [Flavobacterium procerum]|uniref:histidine kinase n=1 Tax=Flavobacterium procerum TaxID=1455569 RepID=A0ABV6BV88_9FLAO